MSLGNYIARLFPLMLAFVILSNKFNKKYIYFTPIILVLSDTLVFLTGERTALGLLLISTVLIILLVSKYKYLRLITFLISTVSLIFISLFFPFVYERNINQTYDQIVINKDEPLELNNLRMFSARHESHFFTALKIFKDNKIIGAGPNSFRKLCDNKKYYINYFSCSTHPHNSYIQILSETGIVGLLFLLLPSIYIIYILLNHIYNSLFFKIKKLSDYQLCLLICFITTLWPLLPTVNFFNNWINVIYYLPLGFYLQTIHAKTK